MPSAHRSRRLAIAVSAALALTLPHAAARAGGNADEADLHFQIGAEHYQKGEFRDALNVDCGYCHGGGKPLETDANPRKDIGRKMIMLVRQINAQFPGTGVFPVGDQKVTCWTCHRGDVHPVSLGNKAYPPPQAK